MSVSKEVQKAGSSAPSRLDSTQVLTASKALLSHIKESAKEKQAKSGKKNLLDDEDGEQDAEGQLIGGSAAETPIWLTLTTKQHVQDSRRLQPSKIVVPHPISGPDGHSAICIFTADPQRAYKNIVASPQFPDHLRQRITRIIDLSHLMKKFKAYETLRKLYAEHDIFLGDERIINRLPSALGKTFYKSTAKRPIPIVLQNKKKNQKGAVALPRKKKQTSKKGTAAGSDERADAVEAAAAAARSPAQIAAEIERAVGAVLVSLSPSTNTAVRVGSAAWPAEHIAANIEVVTQALVGKHVPKGWSNVKALFLKGPRTMALPIWQTDALWVDGDKDILAEGSAELLALEAKKDKAKKDKAKAKGKEKANVGKKRKAPVDEDTAGTENKILRRA